MKISEFLLENFHFVVVKLSVYLNRLVSVMTSFQMGTKTNLIELSPLNVYLFPFSNQI